MDKVQKFGGKWTTDKLEILTDYVDAYLKALQNQTFKKIYIDAFAGSGKISFNDDESSKIIKGSPRRILESTRKFDEYIFIDKSKSNIESLRDMVKAGFPDLLDRITFLEADANEALINIIHKYNWKENRAVLFIDPFATQFNWETLKLVGNTHSFDIWWLFPFYPVNRMLPRKGIKEKWVDRLNAVFGDEEWQKKFYEESPEVNIFDDKQKDRFKICNVKSIQKYIYNRIGSLGFKVAKNSRILYNSKNSPLFIFFFIVTNPRPQARTIAIKIAEYILGR